MQPARPLVWLSSSLLIVCAGAVFQSGAVHARQKPAAPPGVAPIQNPSFEETDGKTAAGWSTARFNRARPEFIVDTIGHTGRHSARIAAPDGADAAWTAIVAVTPYAKYRLSGWIRTDAVRPQTGQGALLNVHGLRAAQTTAVTGTTDWTSVEVTFDTGARDAVQINCLLGGWGAAAGTAWFDDVKLERLSARTLKPQAIVDVAARRAPISKYIYGQFIEHLGRCIYGGIWAEMLEDRKFYYDVGAKDSPWKPVADQKTIVMNPIEAFVGAHSPEIRLTGGGKPAGIAQEQLALAAGRRYTGHIVLAGSPDAGPIRVTLAWGDGPGDRETLAVPALQHGYRTYGLTFTAKADTDKGRLEIVGLGAGAFRVGAVSLMPADNVDGFRADTLHLLRELNAPVYRWPGGNFVSGYKWTDGIGERDRRPPRKNPAWQGVEHNDVGIDEFMRLCELIAAEPYISVNSGFGDADMAAAEVQYVNGAASTPMGKLRAANGHEQPYGCKWWSIGNEMYGSWQLGNMPVADYVRKHNEFARLMKAEDASIRLIGVGDVGPWDEAMLAGAAAQMNLISEHFYCQEAPGLMGHVAQVPAQIRRIAEAHRRYRQTIPAAGTRDLRIAMDEWNYWYGPHVYGELGTRYFLKDALGIAAGFNEYARQSDIVFMANYAQTVNVIGAIKTTKTAAALDATGVVLKLYREHFGTIPVEVGGAPEPLDVVATWKEDQSGLVLSIVNPTTAAQALTLDVPGVRVPPTGRLWRIAGTDAMAYNEPGKPPAISVQETAAAPVGKSLVVPAMSISLFELNVKPPAKKTTEASR